MTSSGNSTGKEGYWDNQKMLAQTEDYMDAFETVYPDKQMVVQFDWSSGHAAGSGDGLCVGKMNLKWGGKGCIENVLPT